MQRTSFKIALTNSRGLATVIFFSGLEQPMVIAPALIDESMLTKQLFYFLSRHECVAWLTFEQSELKRVEQGGSAERRIERIVDNYLFALSRKYPEFRLTSKVHERPFRRDMADDLHFGFDAHITECLALDTLNDDSIIQCELEGGDGVLQGGFDDFLPLREILDGVQATYEEAIRKALSTKVRVTTVGHEVLGTGTHTLPIAKVSERPLAFSEMEMFETVRGSEPGPEPERYFVSRGSSYGFWVPKIVIEQTSRYDPQLLAYYFCALRDPSPLVQFKNYYNVLEFFFEAAGGRAGLVGRMLEGDCLRAIVSEVVRSSDLPDLVAAQEDAWRQRASNDVRTSSGVVIEGLGSVDSWSVAAFSDRIYALRNACVHSKSTRKGRVEARIVPSLPEEEAMALEVPVMREIAARCIELHGRLAIAW